ncbi:hypothetical protein SDC9_62412 [bioreactor metagenome]|uniref:Uncharacterized protein n=1 Tax=bioreactor metagenome TaxID=1076179 RepID=A0A644XJP8_9ZZZZ
MCRLLRFHPLTELFDGLFQFGLFPTHWYTLPHRIPCHSHWSLFERFFFRLSESCYLLVQQSRTPLYFRLLFPFLSQQLLCLSLRLHSQHPSFHGLFPHGLFRLRLCKLLHTLSCHTRPNRFGSVAFRQSGAYYPIARLLCSGRHFRSQLLFCTPFLLMRLHRFRFRRSDLHHSQCSRWSRILHSGRLWC